MPDSHSLRRAVAVVMAIALCVSASFGGFAAESSGSGAEIMNEAELEPDSPGSEALGELLDELMPEIFEDAGENLDTYEQIKACYDYLVANMSYGSHTRYLGTTVRGSVTCGDIYRGYGAVEGYGAVALTAKTGMCNAYASAFILMARRIGFDAYLVKGSTKSGGGYAYHEWAEIDIDGTIYLFDPQLEQNLTASGLPKYTVFFRTYDEIPGRYIKN